MFLWGSKGYWITINAKIRESFVGWEAYIDMKNKVHINIGWCAGLAIGITVGITQSNMMLGIGLGVAFGASLGHIKMKNENSSSELD